MTYCLWCEDEIVLQVSWINLISKEQQNNLCPQCVEKLSEINGKRCIKCSRETSESICYDCERWDTFYNQRDPLKWNYSIFHYNSFIKDIITQWKYRGDYALVKTFKDALLHHFKFVISKIEFPYIIVPIPLSEERLCERGFNQAESLAKYISSNYCRALVRGNSEKQSKRSRKERLLSKNPFQINIAIYKSVILVDDIYTTGSTVRQAASLLKESGCPNVYSYTLVRG